MQVRRILSLDGGGIRGLVSALWLEALEAMLAARGKGRLGQHFDLIAGTSTGALIACGVAAGMPASAIVQLYEGHAPGAFPDRPARLWSRLLRLPRTGASGPKYDGRALGLLLQRIFGARGLGELSPRVLVTAYDLLQHEAVFFKSWTPQSAAIPIAQACLASTAAPTFFPAVRLTALGRPMSLVDGGVVANNPTACAIAEAVRLNAEADPSSEVDGLRCGGTLEALDVLSLGTGEAIRPLPASAEEWGALEWAVPLIGLVFDGSADAVDYTARQLLRDGRYLRLQVPLEEAAGGFDEVSPENVAALRRDAERWLARDGVRAALEALADRL